MLAQRMGNRYLVFIVALMVLFVLTIQHSQNEVVHQIAMLEKRSVELQREVLAFQKDDSKETRAQILKLISSLKVSTEQTLATLPPAPTVSSPPAVVPPPTPAATGTQTKAPRQITHGILASRDLEVASRYCKDLSPSNVGDTNVVQADDPWDTLSPNVDVKDAVCNPGPTCQFGTCESNVCRCNVGAGGKYCDFRWSEYLFAPVEEVFNFPLNDAALPSVAPFAMTTVPKGATMIADIGAGLGLSTAALAKNLHKNGQGGFIMAVDSWTGTVSEWSQKTLKLQGGHPHLFDKFFENVKRSGVSRYVSPFAITEASAARFLKLRPQTRYFDLIRISQNFSPDETFDAIRNWWPLLRVGGIVQGTSLPFVRNAVIGIAKVVPCELRLIGPGDWQIKKLSHDVVCIQNPAQIRIRDTPTWVTNWQCIESECNGGSCDGDRCSCPIGKGGQRCEISTKWHGDDDPFADKPLSKYAEGSTSGWHGGLENFRDIFNEIKINTAIDVGVWMGQSSITMAKLLKQQGKGGILISVDPWCGSVEHWRNGGEGWNGLLLRDRSIPMIFERYRSNVIREQVEPFVLPFPVGGHVAAQIFSNLKLSADIVHVDGSHEYEDVVVDLRDWWPIVRPGGVLYGDDYSWRGVAKAVEEFRELHGAKVSIYGPGKEKGLADCRACKFAIHKPLTEPKHPFVPEIITFGDIKS
eukprot:TRINITY_DN3026_c0_g1_i2.p1 TRINITY_DN3026_c0_g1~~TRINITY_DN3026_c0_g1_i2.p1  ORF type:complete len:715 (+),score=151.26 TRINITY_DN3026_c0_g1_i2:58-2145(+)